MKGKLSQTENYVSGKMIISAAKYSGAQYIIAFLLAIYSHRHQIAACGHLVIFNWGQILQLKNRAINARIAARGNKHVTE